MIFAYVSDENYLAINGVTAECSPSEKEGTVCVTSSPSGALRAPLVAGRYRITLAKDGYGSKHVECEVKEGTVHQLRLMSDTPCGFMWPKWSKGGERSEIRAHAAEQYQLSLWRYGLTKEPYGVLSWFDEHGPQATRQILPDGDLCGTGVQWNRVGYPAPHPQQTIPAPQKSGLYYIWGKTLSGKLFSFPWVVAPASPTTRLAVLANTNTWNAYNAFGGRSNYINPTGLPNTPTVYSRQDLGRYQTTESVWAPEDDEFKPLSFERPEPGNDIFGNTPWDSRGPADSIEGRMQCGQTPGEWRLLAWLEREGFAYDYYSDAQLEDGTLDLAAYSVLLVGVHPEYWSRTMFAKVENWVRAGGRLMYLGGNGLNCEIVFGQDDTMRCLSHEDMEDNKVTGNESRMHRTYKPETSLLGVTFTSPGAMTAAPYAVRDESHWVFRGAGLKNGDSFGNTNLHERVPGGASGHETDKIMPNSPQGLLHLAKGMNPDNGGSDMVLFNLDKGRVFSTGSITFVSSLFPDAKVSRITRNVLDTFLRTDEA